MSTDRIHNKGLTMGIEELARQLQGKNHAEIARRAGLTRAYVNAIAKKVRTNPTLETANKILAAIATMDGEVANND